MTDIFPELSRAYYPIYRMESLPAYRWVGRVKQIQMEECDKVGITLPAMLGPGKAQYLVIPRWAAMVRCRDELGLSTTQIGREFGNRDHTTVVHAIREYRKRFPSEG